MRPALASSAGTGGMPFACAPAEKRDLLRSQALQPFTNSIRLLTAMPDGPLAIHGFDSSIQAVPPMSRRIQGLSTPNPLTNIAAEMAPPQPPPDFTISSMLDLMTSLYSSTSGSRHIF